MKEKQPKKRKTVEIEQPAIPEVDHRTLHPGVKEEQEQGLMKDMYDDNDLGEKQIQG
ncbi:hypothetical protein [Alkalihalobacillus sp. AL-G]|uniref:hypothetical protein n=1 Tax=Alkalihalobacillus sp. AL-G TaxID=2926399 RepID=UPI00272C5B57|nr:hypothetical protein [Alkalihalobacillus sp. AL-G]WLD92757.1 hypothetical protein MOJ78_17365 [Alkalihalobacillus sp. AL-G]